MLHEKGLSPSPLCMACMLPNQSKLIACRLLTSIFTESWRVSIFWKQFSQFSQVYWFGPIIGALFASGIYHVAQNFPVTTEDELVITGKEIKNEAKPQGFELEGHQNPSQADMQTQTPYELKTTV